MAEAFTLIGAFTSEQVNGLIPRWMSVVASIGILLSAAYFLWTLQRMFFGQLRLKGAADWLSKLSDVNAREKLALIPLVALALALGIFPSLLFDKMNASVLAFIQLISG
jgi:NADH-quinone oxidoreductase subunit M